MTKRNMIGGPQTKAMVFSTGTCTPGFLNRLPTTPTLPLQLSAARSTVR